jgi:ribonuclease BN (tRNA processing enzyme)
MRKLLLAIALAGVAGAATAQPCGGSGVGLQVLGSGGPELQAKRAGSGYLLWLDGKARVLVNAGGGTALRVGESGARLADLDAVLFTGLQADHAADLPALVQASRFENRERALPVFGPSGNRFMPSTVTFVRSLFDSTRGAFRHLGEFLSPLDKSSYKLEPHDVRDPPAKIGMPASRTRSVLPVFANERMRITAATVTAGNAPALVFRIEAGGKSVVAGMDADRAALTVLASGADLLIAALPPGENRDSKVLPALARIAQDTRTRQLVLAQLAPTVSGHEEQILAAIRQGYTGTAQLADDLACFLP